MVQKKRINVAAALDSNYVKYAYVMLTSLFENQTSDCQVYVYLLQSGLKKGEKECLQELVESYEGRMHWLNVDVSVFPANISLLRYWSLEAYYRLMLQDILPEEVDRILYLDIDIIVNKPLDELYDMDFEGKLLCACSEPFSGAFADARDLIFKEFINQKFVYFNSGVLLLNIESMRKKYCLEDYLKAAEKLNYQMVTPDQDLLNYVHWQEVKYIDASKYNLYARFAYNCGVRYEEVKEKVTIIHFLGNKPWNGKAERFDIEQLWWDYAEMTPFYEEIALKFLEDAER